MTCRVASSADLCGEQSVVRPAQLRQGKGAKSHFSSQFTLNLGQTHPVECEGENATEAFSSGCAWIRVWWD